jgi:hypothetical protein
MAESVKRRVAAARLAVAFVAAGTIAGAAAWAQASPAPTAKQSILISSIKIDSSNIKNGSLLFADFIKGEVPSGKQFKKLESSTQHYKQTTNASLSTIKGEIGDIKSQLGSYIKGEAADARYIKLTDAVVRGDGSVHTATGLQTGASTLPLLSVQSLVTVEGIAGSQIRVTNNSGGPLTHSACTNGQGQQIPAGVLQPGASLSCTAGSTTQSLQLIGAGADPAVMTLSFSGISTQAGTQDTVQILIGL